MSRLDPASEPHEPEPVEPGAPQPPALSKTAPVPAPHALRASHEDRDAVVEQLRVAAGDGRLTAEELDERLETALNARTYGELAVLVQDLPVTAAGAGLSTRAALAAEAAPEVLRLQARHSSLSKTGHWVVPQRLEVDTKSANAIIDLTRAVVSHPVLDLVVSARSTNLRIMVKPGIVVEVADLAVHSSNVRQRAAQLPDTPVTLLVRLSGDAHSSNIVVSDRPHEGYWARRRRLRAAARQGLPA